MNKLIRILFITPILLLVGAPTHLFAATARPNFVVILADDMGFSDAGCYGGEIQTPTLDRLAGNGIRFTQFYNAGRCWPTRLCVATGMYEQQLPHVRKGAPLPGYGRVAPHYLKAAGYRSYHAGKWHLHRIAATVTGQGGFDRSYCLNDHDRFFSPRKHLLDDRALPVVERGTGHYATTAIATHAIDFLEEHQAQHAEQPFFLYLAFIAPHFPLHALQEDIDRYRDAYDEGWDAARNARIKRLNELGILECGLSDPQPQVKPGWNLAEQKLKERIGPGEAGQAVPWDSLTDEQKRFQATKMAIHAAMIDRMDQEIGRVVDQLKAMDAYENTVIFFLSDNGASAEQIIRGDGHDKAAAPGSAGSYLCLGPGWSTAANTPFRYHKSWVHEGGISTPLIVHWPAGLKAKGELRRTPGHAIDVVPTMLELAGISDTPAWKEQGTPPLQGQSLVPALKKDQEIPRDYLYFNHSNNRALRIGDWKLVAAGKTGPWELYNLATDRAETTDLAAQHPEKVKDMSEAWARYDAGFKQK